MSTFSGKIQEIPNISVDRFDNYNLKSEAYFLSHCHYDHMVGLYEDCFQNMLIHNNKFIYVSDVTRHILMRMYPKIRNNIKVLDMYTATLITLKDKNISVIPLPAGHCPGSVMFLFEDKNSCILYTGDYRINKNDIQKFKSLYNSFNEVKIIDKIYLDTTFFLKQYLKFPTREESLNELCRIIKEWTDKGQDYLVKLFTSAKYGYEYVFNEIHKKNCMPVHVNRDMYEFYSIIPEMDKSVTKDGSLTQVHSNCGGTYQSICKLPPDTKLKTIRMSAIRWQHDNLESGLSSSDSNMHYVCYSTHASYEEGVALIKFLKPKSIEACVTYDDPYKNVEIMRLIKENLEELRKEVTEIVDKPKLFDSEGEDTTEVVVSEDNTCLFNDDFGILDSPPRDNVQEDKSNINLGLHETTKSLKNETLEILHEKSVAQEITHSVTNELSDFFDLDSISCYSLSRNKENSRSTEKIESKSDLVNEFEIIDSPPRNNIRSNKTNKNNLGSYEATKSMEDETFEMSVDDSVKSKLNGFFGLDSSLSNNVERDSENLSSVTKIKYKSNLFQTENQKVCNLSSRINNKSFHPTKKSDLSFLYSSSENAGEQAEVPKLNEKTERKSNFFQKVDNLSSQKNLFSKHESDLENNSTVIDSQPRKKFK